MKSPLYLHAAYYIYKSISTPFALQLHPTLTSANRGNHVLCLSHAGHVLNAFTAPHVPPPSLLPLPTPGAGA